MISLSQRPLPDNTQHSRQTSMSSLGFEPTIWLEVDCWLEVSIRKVLRPATSIQVFIGFPVPKSKCWDSSQDFKLPLHAFYFRSRTAGLKSVFGRSCDRPLRHRFFLVSLCLKSNAEMVPKIPSCHYTLFTLDPGLLAWSQYSEGPATDHLDTDFSWFPCS